MANPINITPGHGKGGRHATAETLEAATKVVALAGQADPGMFGRMFPQPPAAEGAGPAAAGTRRRDG